MKIGIVGAMAQEVEILKKFNDRENGNLRSKCGHF